MSPRSARRHSPGAPGLLARLLAAVAVLAVLVSAGAAPAWAEEPLDVSGQVTDRADALGGDRARVQAALDELYERTGRQLFVVYVDDFGDLTGSEWATRTAEVSGLGRTDVLLAVALRQRSYGYDADAEDFSDADLERVDREFVLPALREDDWAGAAVGAAEGLAEVDEGSGLPWGWIVGGVGALAAAGAWGVHRARRRYDHTHPVVDEHGEPVDPAAILTDDELEAAAASALVQVDDALQTADQELGFAEAQLGAEAVVGLRAAVDAGRAQLREAFALRQRLDDAEPESDAERRTLQSRVLQVCRDVDASLAEQVERLDAVRALQDRVPEASAALQRRVAELRDRLPRTATTLETLASTHAGRALAAVSGNVDRARVLLDAADAQHDQAQTSLAADDRAAAALHLRTAEESAAQAGALLDAVETARVDLEAARERADDLLTQVTATVSAVSTYVQTHRGAIGPTARTRLSESARLLDEGRTTVTTDPDAARAVLERSAALVAEAQSAAEADVAAWRAAADRDRSGHDLDLGGIAVGADRGVRLPRLPGGLGRGTGGGRRPARTSTRSRRGSTTRRSSGGRPRRSAGGRF